MLYVLIVILTIVAIVCLDHYVSKKFIANGKRILEREDSPYSIYQNGDIFYVSKKTSGSYLRYVSGEISWGGWLSDAYKFKSMDEVHLVIGSIK